MALLRGVAGVSLLLMVGLACGDAEQGADAGLRDAGSGDGGAVDGGVADAASPDADSLDAGAADASVGTTEFARWFADYNEGMGTAYLDDAGEAFPEGDPEHHSLPRHSFFRDMAYGPHGRNRVDLWVPETEGTPGLVIYFHGGGFTSGSRSSLSMNVVRALMTRGIAVARADYRFGWRSGAAARAAGAVPQGEGSDPNTDGARLDWILRDCGRVVQYLRHREDDFGLRGARVGALGSSAGGGCAVWMGAAPELALPEHEDPVLRQSTRIDAVVHLTSQSTYNFQRWPDLLSVEQGLIEELVGDYTQGLTQQSQEEVWGDTPLNRILDFAGLLSSDDPPLWSENDNPALDSISTSGELLHLPRGHHALYEHCVAAGMDCALRTESRREGDDGDIVGFLVEALRPSR